MSDRDENSNLQDNTDRQKVAGSNLNVLDLQWELLVAEGGYWDADIVMKTIAVDSLTSLSSFSVMNAFISLI